MEKQSFLKSILFLDKMYMPKIINVLYILSVIASIAGGIFLCFYEIPDISISYNMDVSVDMKSYIKDSIIFIILVIAVNTGLYINQVLGIALIILGPIAARIYAELLIILFKINEQTGRLAGMTEKENQQKDI